jgi:predicted transposase/invertase (TIGR01784 family)
MSRTYVSFDWALKRILRDKANFCVLEGFLSELLHDDITIIELLDSEANKEHSRDKFNRVDLLVKTGKDERIIIEVQNDFQRDYFQRMSYGTAKVLTENMSTKLEYREVKRIISVSVVYFDIGEGQDYIYYGGTVFDGVHRHDRLQLSEDQRKAFACHEVGQLFPEYYLIKIKSFADITTDTLDEWIYFLRNSDILPSFKARGLHEARQRLALLQMSREERAAYDDYIENLRFQNSVSRTQLEDLEQARKDAETAHQEKEKAQAEAQHAQAEKEKAQAETQHAQAEIQAMRAKAIAALVAAGLTDEQARASLGC